MKIFLFALTLLFIGGCHESGTVERDSESSVLDTDTFIDSASDTNLKSNPGTDSKSDSETGFDDTETDEIWPALCSGTDACGDFGFHPDCPIIIPEDGDPCNLPHLTGCTYCDYPLESVVDKNGGSMYHSAYCMKGKWNVMWYVGCAVDIWEK